MRLGPEHFVEAKVAETTFNFTIPDDRRCRRLEYVWRAPIIEPVQCVPEPDLQARYTDAVIPASFKSLPFPRLKTEDHIRVKVRTRNLGKNEWDRNSYAIQIWLLANEYTQARSDMLLCGFQIDVCMRIEPDQAILEQAIGEALRMRLVQ